MENDVSHVIDRTYLIENLLNQVIHKYSSPRKEAYEFFWNVLLDSSIVPLGSKIKVAMAISQHYEVKLTQDSLHKLVSFRNAFAHHKLDSHPTLVVGENDEDDELHYMLQIIKQSGKTERKNRAEALAEFEQHFSTAKKSLIELRDAIVSGIENEQKIHNKSLSRSRRVNAPPRLGSR